MSSRFYLNGFQVFENHLLPTSVYHELVLQGLPHTDETEECFSFEVKNINDLLLSIQAAFIDELLNWAKWYQDSKKELPDILNLYDPHYFIGKDFGHNKEEFFNVVKQYRNDENFSLYFNLKYKIEDHRLFSFYALINALPIKRTTCEKTGKGLWISTDKIIAEWR